MKENQNPKAIFLKDYKPPTYLIDKTELRFFLNEEATRVQSRLLMRLHPDQCEKSKQNKQLPVLELNGADLQLISLAVNQKSLSDAQYHLSEEGMSFTPSVSILENETFIVEIETVIKPHENTALEGLYVSKGMYCTQCEAHGFRRITYYLDRPDVMSEFEVYLEADKKSFPVLLSNGNQLDAGELENGRHWAKWHDPFKKPCYLFALVAGNLECVEDEFIRQSGKPVALKLYVEKHDVDKCDYALESLKRAMRWDEKVFGREYDLDIYMIVAVSHFNMGAMENKGLNIFNTSCVLANPHTTTDIGFERVEGVVAHEYFHNWSGNRVTCRDWFQLSLKEGFTVFRDEEFSSDMGSRTVKRIDDVNILRNFQFKEDAGPMAHPVRPASYIEMNNFYTVTVYNKGAEVVRMLQTLLGAKQFRQACDLYFERFDGQAVTCDDFVSCMEEVSGKNLTQFKRWYSQAGTPEIKVESKYDVASRKLTLKLSQQCPATPGQEKKDAFVIPVSLALFSSQGKKLSFCFDSDSQKKNSVNEVLLVLEKEVQEFHFSEVEGNPLPSLLRNFSAPVKLNYNYSMNDLALLMAFDDDGFNAWDAGQRIYLSVLESLVSDYRNGKALTFNDSLRIALQTLFESKDIDKALLARMLSIPSPSYLAEQYTLIDVDAVKAAHQFLELSIAKIFKEQFVELYKNNASSESYEASARQIGQRSLKNVALRYLCLLEKDDVVQLAEKQMHSSNNMSDESAAFRALVSINDSVFEDQRRQAIERFYERWNAEALVIDQWFSIQSSSRRNNLLQDVKRLLSHEDFDFRNPNRVRSVLAAFAQNFEHFHAADGSGYAFFAEQIKVLNGINPQIAARLVAPLIHWKRYEGERGKLMKQQLEMLKELPKLSKDVYEIVDKALL